MKLRSRVTIRIGPVIPYEELGLEDSSREGLKRASALLAERINKQLEEGY